MNAKEYLESKGVFGLDTKKRYNEVIEWMEGYAQERVKNCSIPAVMGELTCDSCGCHPNTIYTTSKGRFCERCKPAS
jgi:hypothetical protein